MSFEDLTPWPPGVSGNPKGKPKGARNRRTIYLEHLEKKGIHGLVVDDMVLAAIENALDGDIAALKELMDSAYGKVPDKNITAETTPELIDDDITQKILDKIPVEELEKILKEIQNENVT